MVDPKKLRVDSGFVAVEGGMRLYWKATGAGPRTIVCCNGVGVSTFFWKFLVEHFADRFRVVVWDYRAHGRSDRPHHPDAVDLRIETAAQDLGVVIQAAGAQSAVLVGHSMGCQVILERALQAPDQVDGLVLMLGSAGRVLDTFYDTPRSADAFRVIRRVTDLAGSRANRMMRPLLMSPLAWPVTRTLNLVDPLYTRWEDFRPYLHHMASMDLRVFLRMVEQAHKHDAFPRLSQVHAPALIIAAERDTFTPLWLSYKMQEALDGAEIMVLADATHTAIIEQPRTINHRLERFLEQRIARLPPAP